MNEQQLNLWINFCNKYIRDNVGIPLFKTNSNIVEIQEYGKHKRLSLIRSNEMENFLVSEVEKVLNDFHANQDEYEGLIYIMYKLKNNLVVPLYIGKSEKYGKQGDNLSENIANIRLNKSKFCRWGNNYAYHIGDLSAVVCPGHPEDKKRKKYKKWARAIFEDYPSYYPVLKEDIYFWIGAWKKGNQGIFSEFGATPLTALEYQLISVAATLFPNDLLNEEGVNRGRKMLWIVWLTMYLMNPIFYLVKTR